MGLLILAAVGVGGTSHHVRAHEASPNAVRMLVDIGFGVVATVVILVAGLLVDAFWTSRKRKSPAEQPFFALPPVPWALRVALALIVFVLALGFAAIVRGGHPDRELPRPAPPSPTQLAPQRPEPTTRPIGADAPAVLAIVVLGLGTLALFMSRNRWRRGSVSARTSPWSHPTGPADTEDIGLDDLETHPDPREAVVAAYARMERLLARAGVARDPAEAPFEYLRRVRRELQPAGAPAGRLTELFERAKFSAADIEPAMRAAAVGALRNLMDEVHVP